MKSSPDQPTAYFDTLAGTYAAHRPGYPAAAIDWIVEGLAHGAAAADVGCGTGISTRLLAARGLRVIGIDPSAPMLAEARQASASDVNGPVYQVGTGECTGLANDSVDMVVCAQSFHWFDPPTALAEFRRILKPREVRGGGVALMWNRRVGDAGAFDAVVESVTNRSQDDASARGLKVVRHRAFTFDDFGDQFTDVETRDFDNAQQMTFEQLLGRLHSASYFPQEGSPLRAELEGDLREAFEAAQQGGLVTMAQVTSVTRARVNE